MTQTETDLNTTSPLILREVYLMLSGVALGTRKG